MAKRVIYAGVTTNDGKGDTLKVGAQKINDNFTELYTALGADSGSLSVVSGLVAGAGITVSSQAGLVTVTSKVATDTVLGGVKIGDNLNITEDGVLSANAGNYSLPVATGGTLGGVKVTGNDGIAISGTGVISVTPYSLPTATDTVLGGIKVGARLAITNGVLSATDQSYTLPKATDHSLGGVIVDGSTISINGNGVISVISTGGSGGLDLSTETLIDYNSSSSYTQPTLVLGPNTGDIAITQSVADDNYRGGNAIKIQGQRGYGTWSTTGPGGNGNSIKIWAGAGGESSDDVGGHGGNIELIAGAGQADRNGGFVTIRGGDAQYTGNIGNPEVFAGDVNIYAGSSTSIANSHGGNILINAGTGQLSNGSINLNADHISISSTVNIATNVWGNTAFAGATTVIYTAKGTDLASIRVHASIEGNEDGDTTGYHTQACDMMIVRRISTLGVSTVDSVVYSVIYTGAAPLATLDAQWNAVTNKIEIIATPVSTTNSVFVKVYATEVVRGD